MPTIVRALSARSVEVGAALHDAEDRLIVAASGRRARALAQRAVRSAAAATVVAVGVARADIRRGSSRRRSRAAPGRAIASSGVRKWLLPSMCERKRHAVVTDLRQRREREDLVAAAVGEDRAVPPHEAMQSAAPRRSRRTRVGARGDRRSRESSRRRVSRICDGVSPFTLPWVATGMKAGVATSPCASCRLTEARRRARHPRGRRGSGSQDQHRVAVAVEAVGGTVAPR